MEALKDDVSLVHSRQLSDLLASQPEVPDYTALMSATGRRMGGRGLAMTIGPDMLDMFRGDPNSDIVPLAEVKLTLKNGEIMTLKGDNISRIAKYEDPHGLPELQAWLLNLQLAEHRPPQATRPSHPSPFGLTVTCGRKAGLKHALTVVSCENDTVLVEDVLDASFLEVLSSFGVQCQSVECDDQGMIPESLDDILAKWTLRHPDRPPPRVLYAFPYGNNPKGHSWADERILQIYLVCRKHNLLIFDDGSHYFICWGKKTRSLQSIDVDGRVLRFDTFSNTLGAGHRLGWVTGPQVILDKMFVDKVNSYVHPSTLSQGVLLELLTTWGHERFYAEMQRIFEFYQKRAERIVSITKKHLKGLAEFRVPDGGLFLWLDLLGVIDSTPIVQKLQDRGLIVVAGKLFKADSGPSSGIRMSFGSVPEDKMEKAMELLSGVLRDVQNRH